MDSLVLAKKIADICYKKLGQDTIVLDMSNDSILCDYFVISDGQTGNQLRDMCTTIDHELSQDGIEPKSIQGKNGNIWTLMDYNSVVVHLFITGDRRFYNLEGLWNSAPIVYSPDANQTEDTTATDATKPVD